MLHCFSEANDMQLFDQSRAYLKGQFTIKSKIYIFLLPVVLVIYLDCYGVTCKVLDISSVEMSAFFGM